MARVPEVTAHGMRGLHSTLALEHGASAHVVASSLGHESFSTTVESYAKPEAIEGARQKRVLTVLEGGDSPPQFETIGSNIVSSGLFEK
jgi:integrase